MEREENLKTKAVSGVMWKFLERICAQGISLIVSIILARILVPKDYSVVSVITIFFAFANVIISGGLNAALIQKKNADSQDYSTVLYLSVLISIVIYFILFSVAPLIANAYDQQILVPIIRVMSLVLPINAIKSIYCAYISSTLQFKKFFFATLGGTVVSGVVGIVMALKGYGPWALVAQQMTNAVIDTLILVFVAKLRLVFSFSFTKLKALFRYGWKVFLSSFINTSYTQSKPLFIGLRFSSIDLSYYTKGSSFPNLISETTTNTLSAVLFPALSKIQDNKERLLNWTRRFIKTTSFICFPCMLGLFAVSDNFVLALLTEKWIEASFYIKIFSIAGMFSMIHIGNCETIKAMGRSDVYLKMEIIKKTSYFAILGLFMAFSNNPHILAMSSFLTTAVALIVNSIPNRKLINYTFKNQVLDVLGNLLPASIMCVSVYFIGYIPIKISWLMLIIQVISGMTIYLGICYLFKNKNLFFVINLIKVLVKNSKIKKIGLRLFAVIKKMVSGIIDFFKKKIVPVALLLASCTFIFIYGLNLESTSCQKCAESLAMIAKNENCTPVLSIYDEKETTARMFSEHYHGFNVFHSGNNVFAGYNESKDKRASLKLGEIEIVDDSFNNLTLITTRGLYIEKKDGKYRNSYYDFDLMFGPREKEEGYSTACFITKTQADKLLVLLGKSDYNDLILSKITFDCEDRDPIELTIFNIILEQGDEFERFTKNFGFFFVANDWEFLRKPFLSMCYFMNDVSFENYQYLKMVKEAYLGSNIVGHIVSARSSKSEINNLDDLLNSYLQKGNNPDAFSTVFLVLSILAFLGSLIFILKINKNISLFDSFLFLFIPLLPYFLFRIIYMINGNCNLFSYYSTTGLLIIEMLLFTFLCVLIFLKLRKKYEIDK